MRSSAASTLKHSLLVLAFAAITSGQTSADPVIRLKETCQGAHECLSMTLDVPGPAYPNFTVERSDGLLTSIIPINDDWTDFVLAIEGRLNGADVQPHSVMFRSFTGGLECTAFGQGEVAVVGYSPDEHPLVLTDAGELEIVSAPKLEVGCKDCLRLIDKKTERVIASHDTPSWDPWLDRYGRLAYHYNASGEVFFRDGVTCLQVSPKMRFKAVDLRNCTSDLQETDSSDYGIQTDIYHRYFETRGTGHLMLLTSFLCH